MNNREAELFYSFKLSQFYMNKSKTFVFESRNVFEKNEY